MASNNDHAILDLGIDELQFTTNNYKSSTNTGNDAGGFTSFPDPDPQSNKDTDRIIDDDGAGGGGGGTRSSYLKLAFYQKYFDVEDKDIATRLLYSMLPVPGKSFLQHHIRPKPDLYGPFWACVTLIFSIAISGNVADFLTTSAQGQAKWHYDFHKVNLAATAVFSYAGLVPACLFGYLWWAGHGAGSMAVSFVELVCVYGYSIVIYIPISILWLICVKFGWVQWILVLVAASLSGIVLFTTIWPAVRESAPKSSLLVMVFVLGLHFLLAAGFMLYFFHGSGIPDSGGSDVVTTVQPVTENGNKTINGGPSPAALVQDQTDSILNAITSEQLKNETQSQPTSTKATSQSDESDNDKATKEPLNPATAQVNNTSTAAAVHEDNKTTSKADLNSPTNTTLANSSNEEKTPSKANETTVPAKNAQPSAVAAATDSSGNKTEVESANNRDDKDAVTSAEAQEADTTIDHAADNDKDNEAITKLMMQPGYLKNKG
eukprot:TRINITY_DN4840_c0_g1_i2.p1 TRINITY_DN4840_c0_g1~~TRINITY_DN4840_c0_g1_i2.p1  ORF type:complete len:490 (-),score=122.36 TRINITY_DN4840_c0_g1_i2:342-1811(-)